jgi:hypothetical protein
MLHGLWDSRRGLVLGLLIREKGSLAMGYPFFRALRNLDYSH